jgi:hypothetical protein
VPRVEAAILIRAPWTRVAALYRDWQGWPRLFSATIRGVRLVRSAPGRTELEIDHREGVVPNVLTEVAPDRVDLWESKRRYQATFVNRFEPVGNDTRYVLVAEVRLQGPAGLAALLGPILRWYIRHQMRHYVLEPMRRAAEAPA